ncbi:MAG: sulfite reductase (NADPH) hemoprotein beta-component/sulfite reductase (ferredoxin) [Chloroflexi bacterium]|nr:MAG: sulfite reductase (NADPH) hemoprotein beta-component/sulfite reductase (ferredoxin) [Chloroflexota bacterium]
MVSKWEEGLHEPTMEEKAALDYSKGVIPHVPQEVVDFEAEVRKWRSGEWTEEQFIPFRLVRGVYGQRQPDSQMHRIKIPFGGMTADELDVIGDIVDEYAPMRKGHITTRENIQIHFIKVENNIEIIRRLGEVGLGSREACGNTVRNVIGCPISGVTPEEPFYVSPYVAAYARWWVRHPFSQKLPRKMKVSFSSCARDCVVSAIHDMAFIPKIQRDENGVDRKGFQMLVGGGTSIMPRLALTLYDFVPVEEYIKVSEAVIRIFNVSEELRKNRMKARIKFHIDRVGIEAFQAEVKEELKKPWAQKDYDPTPLLELPDEDLDAPHAPVEVTEGHREPEYQHWLDTNAFPQKQEGYNYLYVKVPQGDLTPEQFHGLATIARDYAGSRARVTVEQNVVFRWIPDGYLHNVWEALNEIGLGDAGAGEITDVVTCPGTDSCKLGITSSMGLGRALMGVLEEMNIQDPLVKSMNVKASGCPNGCSRHHIASIGFHGAATKGDGNQVPAYETFLGGNFGTGIDARFGVRVKNKVPAKRVPQLLRHYITYYQEQRKNDEPFNDFVDRVGTDPFEAIALEYKDAGPLNKDNIDTYLDWSKSVLYKLERGEGECAV